MTKKLQNKKRISLNSKMFSFSRKDDVVFDENGTPTLSNLQWCRLSPFLVVIPDDAISSCAVDIPDVVVAPQSIIDASDNAFRGCNFKYIYQVTGSEERILSSKKLDIPSVRCVASLDILQKILPGLTAEKLMELADFNELINYSKKIGATKSVIPFEFYCKLRKDNMLETFMQNAYFKFFNKELVPYLKKVFNQSPKEQSAFFAFAYALGCFSKEYMVDGENQPTQSLLCHKASNLLARLLQSETLKIGYFEYLFNNLPTNIKPSQNFYHFLSAQNAKNNFVNAKILFKNSLCHKDYFLKVMQNFEKAKGFKKTLDSEGQPVELTWETALNVFYHSKDYKGITKENSVMAKIYGCHGIKQKTFLEACDIFEEARLACTPHHILEKPLKEENDGTKMFTYEFLDKHDPKNGILGLYCSCCATLASDYYGRDITISSILEPDVQNVVVRDKNGTIIGKGTMYVNAKKGYAVFNDFEIEYNYRSDREYVWSYDDESDESNVNELKRMAIMETFMRAVKDFKVEYDKQHPEMPLKKVAVGNGFNKLKDICEEYYEKAQPLLKVPKRYNFRDADNHQFLLLGKNNKRKKKVIQEQEV